jgi:hypothetical protein
MKTRFLRVMVCLVFGTLSASAAQAALLQFDATLGPEVSGATGSGTVLVTVDDATNMLQVATTFSGLSGVTTVSHIHCCIDPPGTVGVAVTPGTLPGFPAGVSAGSYLSPLLDLTDTATYTTNFLNTFGGGTAAGAQAALLAGMQSGRAYFNIHTNAFTGGEIRGFLQPVPEPTTLILLASGLVGLAARRRRVTAAPDGTPRSSRSK